MFERPAHRDVQVVLESLDAGRLASCGFFFGGGTRLVLDLGEYRESYDIDFLCSDPGGYGDLRLRATTDSYRALFTPQGSADLSFPRELRIDQYGIRFPVVYRDRTLKVELIREARIELDPGIRPPWSPVACLSLTDCYAEKLLANSDRWADRQVLSRDLIDLAALRSARGPIPELAWSKAEQAYRSAPRTDLKKALTAFADQEEHRRRCFEGLKIEDPQPLLRGLARLKRELAKPPVASSE